LYLTYW